MTQRVLVVDDSSTIRHLLTFALGQEGFDVSSASNGEEALASIRRQLPDVVITDAVMPLLTGYDLCRELRNDAGLSPQPHVIMITDSGQEVDQHRAEKAGVDEFMTKPFSPSALRARVREILDGHGD
jgi:DNA-binding response OmpR family regulator